MTWVCYQLKRIGLAQKLNYESLISISAYKTKTKSKKNSVSHIICDFKISQQNFKISQFIGREPQFFRSPSPQKVRARPGSRSKTNNHLDLSISQDPNTNETTRASHQPRRTTNPCHQPTASDPAVHKPTKLANITWLGKNERRNIVVAKGGHDPTFIFQTNRIFALK